ASGANARPGHPGPAAGWRVDHLADHGLDSANNCSRQRSPRRETMSIVKFVIFAFPRSGSTYLCSRLENHPGILCHYELFHPDAIAPAAGFVDRVPEFRAFTPTTRDQDIRAFVDTVFEHDLGAHAVGFKIFLDHNEAAQDLILNDRSILKVLLK